MQSLSSLGHWGESVLDDPKQVSMQVACLFAVSLLINEHKAIRMRETA